MNLKFVWKVHLKTDPGRLWRYIADTSRLNEAAGLPEWKLSYIPESDGGSHQVGELRYMGWRVRWDEHPFEWIESRQYEVVRSYHNGPLRRFRMAVFLRPENGGTLLEEVITVEPRWLLLVPPIYWEVGWRSRRRFERVYRRIDRFLGGDAGTPFQPVRRRGLSTTRVQTLGGLLRDADGAESLPHLLRALENSDDEELDRMRAFRYADRWGADRLRTLKLFLHAANAGLLDVSWDVICPSCRGAKVRESRLRDLRKEAHCDACNIRYTADFADSVEVTFRPNAGIRRLNVTDYCSGGPMNAPHVIVQQQIPAEVTRTLTLQLEPWTYRLRSLKLRGEYSIRVIPESDEGQATITLGADVGPREITLNPNFTLSILNSTDKTHTVMLERRAEAEQATTAARVTALPEFRTLFSSEVLSPDTQVRAGTVCLMFTDLQASTAMYEQIGETSAYARVRQHFELLRDVVAAADGAFVKTIGDAVMAVFPDGPTAIEAAFGMHDKIEKDNRERQPALTLKIGIHQGSCFAVNLNDSLDYFGTTVNIAARVERESRGGDVVVTDEVYQDSEAQKRLATLPHGHEEFDVQVRGLSGTRRVHRLRPRKR